MKRTILTLVLALMIGLVYGQVTSIATSEYYPPAETVTVKDTTFKQDARLNYMVTTILPAVQKFLSEEIARQKVAGEVTYLEETEKLFQGLQLLVSEYAQSFIEIKEIQIDPVDIATEIDALNAKIEALQTDPDIKHIEALREYQNIQERAVQLNSYTKQIESKKQIK
jgi:hypothetical protein